MSTAKNHSDTELYELAQSLWSHGQGRAERSQQQVKVFNEWSHPSYFRAACFPSGECALSCMWTRCGGSSWLASIEKPVTGFIHECVCVCVHARTYGGQNTGCILRQGFSLNMELRLVASKPDIPVSAPPSMLVLWACVWSHLAFYVGAGSLT